MADRPGDPDAALIRYALEGAGISGLAATAALDRLTARLSEAEAALPDTFYAHLLLPDRVRNMVAGWQKAIEVVNELEARLSVCEQALQRACNETDYCYVCDCHPSHGHAATCVFARAALTTEPGHPATSE